jgi:hypothetical protein
VIPQYEVHGYFIDLAVIGQKSKLAVECDGDHWHGAEQWEKDAARQRDLERCGWPFFRLRECSFYLDPEGALEPLWQELTRHGIRPLVESAEPEAEAGAHPPGPDGESAIGAAQGGPDQRLREDDEFENQDPSLPAYAAWEPHPIPNPRVASRDGVIEALIEIVETEGPVTWRRVFDRYRVGLDLGRLKGPTRDALEAAARLAVRTDLLLEWRETSSEDWYDRLVRVADSEAVRLRQRGPRELKDVPPSEIAELMRVRQFLAPGDEWVLRQILASYGLRRLTEDAKAHLHLAVQMVSTGTTPE